MKRIARELGFAFAAWLLPFAAAFGIYTLKASHPLLFDTLMGVVVAGSTTLLGCIYLRRKCGSYIKHGVRIGVAWTVANWLLDGLMFSSGPMKMSFEQYAQDIGLAYLAIPAITIGLGFAASRASRPATTS